MTKDKGPIIDHDPNEKPRGRFNWPGFLGGSLFGAAIVIALADWEAINSSDETIWDALLVTAVAGVPMAVAIWLILRLLNRVWPAKR